ncbi:hypothetical protein V7S43_013053 [Phytophthora oleae]|uniref:BAR domain-containing protein n=1 Tax=Phytophthora oleae TaxID=2107226 RepID=A0ABD3F4K1_9STRA
MAKKKSKKVSSTEGAGEGETGSNKGNNAVKSTAKLFTTLQEKGAAWYGREREGIAAIERFQSALLALRAAQAAADNRVHEKEKKSVVLAGLAGNADIDPWLAEDLYEQVHGLSSGFEELLEDMYTLQEEARDIVLNSSDEGDKLDVTELRAVDYLQMISQELATFEAEYQHIEALLQLISFETSTDELRTLVISWSTSPFLDPAQTSMFRQRHQLSQQLHE